MAVAFDSEPRAVAAREGRKEMIEGAVLLDDDHHMGEILTLLGLPGRQKGPLPAVPPPPPQPCAAGSAAKPIQRKALRQLIGLTYGSGSRVIPPLCARLSARPIHGKAL